MKALVVHAGKSIALEDVPVPLSRRSAEGAKADTSDCDCLVRVSMAGICGTDLQMLEGYAGFAGIPGHEFVGVVESAPPATRTGSASGSSAKSTSAAAAVEWCAAGVKEHCDQSRWSASRQQTERSRSTGAAGRESARRARCDRRRAAVFVEPVAAACRIFEQMRDRARQPCAIVGDGRMGLLVAQVIRTVAPRSPSSDGTSASSPSRARWVSPPRRPDALPAAERTLRHRGRRHRPPGGPEPRARARQAARHRRDEIDLSRRSADESCRSSSTRSRSSGRAAARSRPAIELLASGAVQRGAADRAGGHHRGLQSAFADATHRSQDFVPFSDGV